VTDGPRYEVGREGLPQGLVQQSAKELLAQHERCDAIRRVDGDRFVDRSVKDVYTLTTQISPDYWRCDTIEPLTIHGTVRAYGRTQAIAEGSNMKMACIKALITGGVFNEREPARDYVCERLKFIAIPMGRASA
jgi:hypothetical protein